LHLAHTIADHPWVDSADEGAAFRIAMTVAAPGKAEGILRKLITTGDGNVSGPYAVESLSALFSRMNKKRTEQIEGMPPGVGRIESDA
jgi:hypothetical protein